MFYMTWPMGSILLPLPDESCMPVHGDDFSVRLMFVYIIWRHLYHKVVRFFVVDYSIFHLYRFEIFIEDVLI